MIILAFLCAHVTSCYRIFKKKTVVRGKKFVCELNSFNAFNANLTALKIYIRGHIYSLLPNFAIQIV